MIKNFDEIKKQLSELADVVNAFKSEAVQLRLIELVFGAAEEREEQNPNPPTQNADQKRKKPARPLVAKKAGDKMPRGPRTGGTASKAILARLHAEGFFKKPQTLNNLIQHSETNLARKFKQSEFSGALARYVRDKKLKRAKNSDDQYEYTEA